MTSPNAKAFSKMLSTLTGVPVQCTQKHGFRRSGVKLVYGIYNELSDHDTILLRADLPLLASLGGSLVGLSDSLIGERIKEPTLDESLRNSMRQVLNATSPLLSGPERVVFKSMCTDVQYLTGPARNVLHSHLNATCFDVSVQDYTGGQLSILSDL